MSLFIRLTFAALLSLTAPLAYSQQYYDTHDVKNNDDYFTAEWRKLKNSITNFDLKLANLIPTDVLLDGISILPQYEKGSDMDRTNTAGHHSSVDVWKLKTQFNSDFFNMSDIIGLNVEIGKEVTYIQQFKRKTECMLRLPYNPLNKIPLKSELFFKMNDDSTLVFKEGDLLVFKAPMILKLNKNLVTKLIPYLNSQVLPHYALAGVFNVQVFRMKNNLVRVTITNSLEKTIGINFGLNILDAFIPGYYILGFDVMGKIVSKNLFDTQFIQFGQSTTNLVNHTYDFIFNLNSSEARKQYDSIMGPQLNLFGSKNYEILKRTSSIYKTNTQISKNLEMNFKDLVAISDQDTHLPVNERRIMVLNQGETRSTSKNKSFQLNLLQFFKWRKNNGSSHGLGKSFASKYKPAQNFTFTSTTSDNSMDSFFKWRSRERMHTNVVFENDENNRPMAFKFLHQEVYEEDRSTTPREFEKFKALFLSDLPISIAKSIKWPSWYSDVIQNKKYATLRKEIFINDQIFKSHIKVSEGHARNVLKEILAVRGVSETDAAYLKILPRAIATLFNGLDLLNDTELSLFRYLDAHLNKAPLAREIGLELILKSLSEEDLMKVLYVKIQLAAVNTPQMSYQFPHEASNTPLEKNLTAYKDYVAYNRALGEFNFIDDRSYRLWLYFNRDASIIELNQIIK
jgi:hypothetical protein